MIVLNFSYPEDYVGELAAQYQRYRGVKYHRLAHVRILTLNGEYSRNLGNTSLAATPTTYTGRYLQVDAVDTAITHRKLTNYYRIYGDMTLSHLLRGRNCTDIVHYLLDPYYAAKDFNSRLPGLMYEQLSKLGCPHWYPEPPHNQHTAT